jgi:hypothetical protein
MVLLFRAGEPAYGGKLTQVMEGVNRTERGFPAGCPTPSLPSSAGGGVVWEG